MDVKRRKKIRRIKERIARHPIPTYSKEEYPNKYDWMLMNILFYGKTISSNRIKQLKNGKFPNVNEYILNRFKDTSSYNENIYRILYHIEERSKCPVCGNYTTYLGNGKYSVCCSTKCSNNYDVANQRREQTTLLHYGVKHPCSSEIIKNKVKETCLKKYGVSSYLITEECKKILKEKIGVEYPFQSKEYLEKADKTSIERHGCLAHECTKNKESQEKMKKTFIKRYGVDSFSKTEKFKSIMKEKKEEMNRKRFLTKKQNGTLHTSYEEQKLYDILKKHYPDTISQYSSKEYPFNCDFYIPSQDLYIEYQGYPSHGPYPYIVNEETNMILEKWKKKGYDGWIYDWTKRDVMKRNCAKSHNLKWIEFFYFNIDSFIYNINEYIEKNMKGTLSLYNT